MRFVRMWDLFSQSSSVLSIGFFEGRFGNITGVVDDLGMVITLLFKLSTLMPSHLLIYANEVDDISVFS